MSKFIEVISDFHKIVSDLEKNHKSFQFLKIILIIGGSRYFVTQITAYITLPTDKFKIKTFSI